MNKSISGNFRVNLLGYLSKKLIVATMTKGKGNPKIYKKRQ